MANYVDLGSIATRSDFQSRVAYAMGIAATNVYSEVNTTPGHANRALFATKVANGNYNLPSAALMVLGNSSIGAEANISTANGYAIPDSDIQFAVNSLWNVMAGA